MADKKIANSDKKIKKTNYNVQLYAQFAGEFDKLWPKAAGGKGEQLSAGIMAYMAIYQIDKGLASALTNPDLTTKKAANLILESMREIIYRKALDDLTPEQRAQLLEDARQSEQKIFGKTK